MNKSILKRELGVKIIRKREGFLLIDAINSLILLGILIITSYYFIDNSNNFFDGRESKNIMVKVVESEKNDITYLSKLDEMSKETYYSIDKYKIYIKRTVIDENFGLIESNVKLTGKNSIKEINVHNIVGDRDN